jgi:ribosomal protein S18 acetylase RimI-like enzyme
MLDIIEINETNYHYITTFLSNECPSTFRYFKTRSIDIIKNHILTIVVVNEQQLPIGYAHIDYDKGYFWFGICILEPYQGLGIGSKMIEHILNHEKIKPLNEIYLSVDTINTKAIHLYKKFDFNIVEQKVNIYVMKKIINNK